MTEPFMPSGELQPLLSLPWLQNPIPACAPVTL